MTRQLQPPVNAFNDISSDAGPALTDDQLFERSALQLLVNRSDGSVPSSSQVVSLPQALAAFSPTLIEYRQNVNSIVAEGQNPADYGISAISPTPKDFFRGDLNGDRFVDGGDAEIMIRYWEKPKLEKVPRLHRRCEPGREGGRGRCEVLFANWTYH